MNNCILCHGKLLINTNQTMFDADGNQIHKYQIATCVQCGSGVTVPLPTNYELQELYSSGIYKNQGGKGIKIIDIFLKLLHKMRLNEIKKVIKKTGKLLDIGCGKGRFLLNAKKAGWEIEGQEFSSSQAKISSKKLGVKIWNGELKNLPLKKESYKVITLWHVLEHVPDPKAYISIIKELLEPNGILVIEVPNYDSWQARIGKTKWFQLDVPRHLWQFTSNGLLELLSKNGFKIVETHTLSIELGPFGMLQTLLNRAGFSPQWLFRFLKKSLPNYSLTELIVHICVVIILFIPAVLLEIISVFFKKGGVLRIIAIHDELN